MTNSWFLSHFNKCRTVQVLLVIPWLCQGRWNCLELGFLQWRQKLYSFYVYFNWFKTNCCETPVSPTLKDNINIVVCYFYIMLARLLLASCIYVMMLIYNWCLLDVKYHITRTRLCYSSSTGRKGTSPRDNVTKIRGGAGRTVHHCCMLLLHYAF